MNPQKSRALGIPEDIQYNQKRVYDLINQEFTNIGDPMQLKAIGSILADIRWLPNGRYNQDYGINIFDFTPELRNLYVMLVFMVATEKVETETYEQLCLRFVDLLSTELASKAKGINFGKLTPVIWLKNRVNASVKKAFMPPRLLKVWSQGSFRTTGTTANMAGMEEMDINDEHDQPITSYGEG